MFNLHVFILLGILKRVMVDDDAALDILADILAGSKNSRLT